MIIQPIADIAEICAKHGFEQAVLSPGSRCAPLTLAFARHPDIQTFTIPDERVAGFTALGLSQSSQKPVVVVTTSGTAAANLCPAVIEAFYSETPLLILTADRPPEWTDQQDGQTIRQQNLFENHVRASFQFPVSFDHDDAVWHARRMVNEAIITANGITKGPVHINVPVREPFYPAAEERFEYSNDIRVTEHAFSAPCLTEGQKKALGHELSSYEKIMIVAGQSPPDGALRGMLEQIGGLRQCVILGDIIANNLPPQAVTLHDVILNNLPESHGLQPDLLITYGQSVLSKPLKQFLRRHPPQAHWHIGVPERAADTYMALTKKITAAPHEISGIFKGIEHNKPRAGYCDKWASYQEKAEVFVRKFMDDKVFSEFHAVGELMRALPAASHLHLANSMPVRYANYCRPLMKNQAFFHSNRGTSGIDGCTSTAVGHAVNGHGLHTVLTGDMAFFYDRNALWHSAVPQNLRIVMLNNHGGGIFRLIDGPKGLPELEDYFETSQLLRAENTARDFRMRYFAPKSLESLKEVLPVFFDSITGPAILEIETDAKANQQVFEQFKVAVKHFHLQFLEKGK